jgi:chemotaxis protein histidine kinase CheA
MGTSTNRPKPKSSQSAARNGSGKPGTDQAKAEAAQATAETEADASESTAKAATNGTPVAETTADAGEPTTKSTTAKTAAAETTADAGESTAKTTTARTPAAKPTSGALPSTAKTTAGKPASGALASTAKTTTAKPASGALASTSKATTGKTSAAKSASGALATSSKTPTAKAGSGSVKVVGKATPAPAKTQPSSPLPSTRREQKRETRREELSRKIEERRRLREREQRAQRVRKGLFIGVPTAVVLGVVGILIYNLFFGPTVAAYLKGDPIDGVQCNALEQTVTHYHAHLQIYVDGKQVPIPGDVGRQSVTRCFYWLHVHSDQGDEGVIHIESPDNRTYNLHQFFDIWGQQLTPTNLMGNKVNATHKLTVYVYYDANNQPTDTSQPFTVTPPSNLKPYTGDPTQIVLKPHELIVLEYGTTAQLIAPPPWTFEASE